MAVIGAGYVGLPTAATLAHFGHRVVLAERDPSRLAALRSGRMPIVEVGLEELVAEGVSSGNLHFTASAAEAVAGAAFVFLCVPTPQGDDGSADLSFVEAAAKEVGPVLEHGTIVVNKSTVPVGSATFVEQVIGRSDVRVVSNPEFLREGNAVRDSLHPDRLVVGADDAQAAAMVGRLFAGTGAPLIVTDATTSETIKYASNAFLATKLSYVNAVAGLCEEVGADVRDVMLGLGYDKRIGFEFLHPGPGWGGSCLPKDTRALLHIAQEAGYDFSLLAGAIASNEQQLARVVAKVETACGGSVDGVTVAVWGLTFKANTDDRRDSPSLEIAQRLTASGALVQAFDPTVPAAFSGAPQDRPDEVPDDLSGLLLRADPYEAARGASVVVVLTEWDDFRWLDFSRVLSLMAVPSIVDARNLSRSRSGAASRVRLCRDRAPVSRVVVAGGAGFLGSHLCETLLARGDSVVCLDDLSTGTRDNVAHLLGSARFSLVVGDVSEKVEIGPGDKVDAVCNLASPASPPAYLGASPRDARRRERGHAAAVGAGASPRRPFSDGQHERDLRGSPRPSSSRVVSGQRGPDRSAQRLRRGQTIRREHHHGHASLPRASTWRSPGSSTPTARAWPRATAGSCPTSSARLCVGNR